MQTEVRNEKVRVDATEQKEAVRNKVEISQIQKSIPTWDRMCGICIDEKITILENIDSPHTINDEINGRCFHRAKYKI